MRFNRDDFQRSQRFTPLIHSLLAALGLFIGYLFYSASLFVVLLAHMNRHLPAHYPQVSALVQLFPLVISALAWLLFLWSWRKKWLLLQLACWVWVLLSSQILNYWIHSQV